MLTFSPTVKQYTHAVPQVILRVLQTPSLELLLETWLKSRPHTLDDYDEWARRVDDEAWSWKEVNRKFNKVCCKSIVLDYWWTSNLTRLTSSFKLETYHVNGSQDMKRYVRPSHSAHGHDGYVKPRSCPGDMI